MHILRRPLAIGVEGEYEEVVFESGQILCDVSWFSNLKAYGRFAIRQDTHKLYSIESAREYYSELLSRGFKSVRGA